MENLRFLVLLIREELLVKYKNDCWDQESEITWTDKRSKDFADFITKNIRGNFTTEEILYGHNSISEQTVQRIMTLTFSLKQSPHGSTLRILNNICLYLDYENWNHFCMTRNQKIDVMVMSGPGLNYHRIPEENWLKHEKVISFIYETRQAQFDAYTTIPETDFEKLGKYYLKTSLEYQRIENLIIKMKLRGLVINNKNNPSTFQINSCKIYITKSCYYIITNEYWYLNWFNIEKQEYEHYFSLLTNQLVQTVSVDDLRIFETLYIPVNERDRQYMAEVYQNLYFDHSPFLPDHVVSNNYGF